MSKLRFLTGNALKIIAALLMLIDHIGVFLFPDILVFRYIGRLSFPLFAFMISEGARYTKNKINYVLGIASLAIFCQTVAYFYDNGNRNMSILVTFTLSLLIIFALQNFKKDFYLKDKKGALTAAWLLIFTVYLTFLFTVFISVDYGFIGVLVPVFASLFDFRGIDAPEKIKRLDNLCVRVLCMGVALVILASLCAKYQYLSLLAASTFITVFRKPRTVKYQIFLLRILPYSHFCA